MPVSPMRSIWVMADDFLNVQRRPWHLIRPLSWMLAINHSVGRVDRNMSQSVEMALKVQTEEVLTYVTLYGRSNIHWRHTWQLSNSFFRSFMFVKNHLKVTKKKGNSTQIAGNKTTFADNGEIIFAHFFVTSHQTFMPLCINTLLLRLTSFTELGDNVE